MDKSIIMKKRSFSGISGFGSFPVAVGSFPVTVGNFPDMFRKRLSEKKKGINNLKILKLK
jgi:hypothetical protein